jgi:hypothetical protein
MAEVEPVTPVLTAKDCEQDLPAWGVTREFRFGQFIRLYDERVVKGRRQTTPIVLTADGDIVETGSLANGARGGSPRSVIRADRRARALDATGGPPAMSTSAAASLRTLGLHVIAADAKVDAVVSGSAERVVDVPDIDGLLTTGKVTVRDKDLELDLGAQATSRLRDGEPVMAIARDPDGKATVVRLEPKLTEVELDMRELDGWLATREVETRAGTVRLDEGGIRALLTTGELVANVFKNGVANGLVRITPSSQDVRPVARPAAERIAIDDLAEFLAYPVVPSTTGGSLVVGLSPDATRDLRLGNEVSLPVGDRVVRFICRENLGTTPQLADGFKLLGKAIPLDPLDIKYDLYRLWRELYDITPATSPNGVGGKGGGTKTTEPKDQTIHLAKEGLPVAVLLPWEQTWTLKGFSRGNLISTLALAPNEETTITVSSWERRAKTMQQTAETEIEQTFDFTSTTRDTEDVFREVTSNNEFNAQAHGSLDASYSPGVASIRVSVGGQVENTQSLANTCRTSTQHVRETTSRASTRVRSRRVTTITESIERESTTQVVRHIRNPNTCHTLTMNFHEVLAHYDVDVVFKKDRVRIVVLVPNPVTLREFDELTIRVNEATLRLYLLDEALADGFEACRLLEAYRGAETELRRLSTLAKEEKELDRERTEDPQTTPKKQENPQLAPLTAILADLKRRAALFVGVDVASALNAISDNRTPTTTELQSAQRWLWRRLVAAKFGGGLLGELDRLAGTQNPSPDTARSLLAAVPPNGSFPALDSLGGLSDKEKEDAGLGARIMSRPGYIFWDWGPFWYPNCKREGVYDVDDGGIPGALTQLRTTFGAWEAKESEGAGLQAAAAVVAQATAEQAATTLADRLEMKFGVEIVGAAMERSQALQAHLNQHREYYRYVLFQAMPPSEQLQRLMDIAPQLRVGMFEPHVVASDGPNLAIPLSPLAETTLMKVVTNLGTELEEAAEAAGAAGDRIETDSVILPTPGVSVESWLGSCSGCEEHIEKLRTAEARATVAQARLAELEGDRRKARVDAKDLSDPDPPGEPSLHVRFEQVPPS